MSFAFRSVRGVALAVAFTAAGTAAWADPVHVRGTVSKVDGSAISITVADGKTVGLTLNDDWKIAGVVPATMADIKQGTFIGTANQEDADGNKAIEVVVFPEAMRGTGEGNYGWDLKPKSKMTNATVDSTVSGVDGQTVTLKYKGGEKKVKIAPGTPIVTIAPATASDIKDGAKVFVAGEPTADGTMLTKGFIAVGKDGATPPM